MLIWHHNLKIFDAAVGVGKRCRFIKILKVNSIDRSFCHNTYAVSLTLYLFMRVFVFVATACS